MGGQELDLLYQYRNGMYGAQTVEALFECVAGNPHRVRSPHHLGWFASIEDREQLMHAEGVGFIHRLGQILSTCCNVGDPAFECRRSEKFCSAASMAPNVYSVI
jgi:hypothetical protein